MRLYLLLALCGMAFASSKYIIGGTDVTEDGKWPWQGSVRQNGRHICSITLISSRIGLTTAHCVDDKPVDVFEFMFGSNDRFANTILARAKSITVHEFWKNGIGSYPNDIAFVEFDGAIVGRHVEPIPLTTDGKDHAGNPDCWSTGWGLKEYGGTLPTQLQEAKVKVYTQDECKEIWKYSVGDGHLCAGDPENGVDQCSGDGANPVVCQVFGQYELVGIGTWGKAECDTSMPFGATRIGYYRDWIRRNTGI